MAPRLDELKADRELWKKGSLTMGKGYYMEKRRKWRDPSVRIVGC